MKAISLKWYHSKPPRTERNNHLVKDTWASLRRMQGHQHNPKAGRTNVQTRGFLYLAEAARHQ
eukprot:1862481-Amphidinium_carterae.1